MALPINIHGSTVEWERGKKPPVNCRIPPDISVQGTKLGLGGGTKLYLRKSLLIQVATNYDRL